MRNVRREPKTRRRPPIDLLHGFGSRALKQPTPSRQYSQLAAAIALVILTLQGSAQVQQADLLSIVTSIEQLSAQRGAKLSPPTVFVRTGEDLHVALDKAPRGAVVELERGATFTGNFIVRRAVTIQTRGLTLPDRTIEIGDRGQLAAIVSANAKPALDVAPGVADVTLRRVRFAGSSNDIVLIGHGDDTQTKRDQLPQRITIDQVLIEGTGSARNGIGLHAGETAITRSRVVEIRRAGIESHAIVGWNGSGPYRIERNYLSAGSIDILFGGADPSIPGLVASEIAVIGNTLTREPVWRGKGFGCKNGFELKAARRVVLRGNTIENVWREGQSGWAIMLTPAQSGRNPEVSVEDVTIEENTIRNVGSGINILGYGQNSETARTQRIVIRRNWITTDSVTYGGQGWALYLGRSPAVIAVERNTLDLKAGNQIVVVEGPPVPGFSFTGNLVRRSGAYGFTGQAADGTNQHRAARWSEYFPGGVITRNAFGSFPVPANLPDNLHVATSAMTLIEGRGTGVVESYGRPR